MNCREIEFYLSSNDLEYIKWWYSFNTALKLRFHQSGIFLGQMTDYPLGSVADIMLN
jgi:hypothetical protein